MPELQTLADATDSRDPSIGLRAVAALRVLHDSLEELQVQNARALGWSWQQIADALGVNPPSRPSEAQPRAEAASQAPMRLLLRRRRDHRSLNTDPVARELIAAAAAEGALL